MFELDFLPVGDGERSGDAIALRYSHPETGELVTGIIDTGFEDDGEGPRRPFPRLLRHEPR